MQRPESFRLPRNAPQGLEIARDEHGVPHLSGGDWHALLWGLGYCHALDRGLQLLLSRILSEGRASEQLAATAETLELDRFFRRLNWRAGAAAEAAQLSAHAVSLLGSYTAGINARFAEHVPWELRLVGYTPGPWSAADTILLSRAIGYVGLAQSQAELERLFVEMVQAGVDSARLAALFPNIPEIAALEGADPRFASREVLRQVRLGTTVVPEGVRWLCPVPRLTGSNGWVVAPSRTRSGFALLANDPHLEVNRLPNVWYEAVARVPGSPDQYVIAATMPGLPAALLGRSRELAWGATYPFLDGVDSWVEDCRDGKYRRGDDFIPFRERREEIKRKRQPSVAVTFFENEHGVLDGDPHAGGYLLATRWASASSGARSLEAALGMWTATSVDRGMQLLGDIETAWNWMLADRSGNIGYQMSGLMPKRRDGVSGFVPLPGWYPENDWQGFVPASDLPRAKNPEAGFLVTANQDTNRLGRAKPQNATMADYRADRITARLSEARRFGFEECRALQYDTFSLQAEVFLERLRPLLPDTEAGRLLESWDLQYETDSLAAGLFESFYAELIQLVIGEHLLGPEVAAHLANATSMFASFFKNLDALLLDPPSELCGGKTRDALYVEAFARASQRPTEPLSARGELTLKHLFFGGKLPRWTGFDRGPLRLPGGRATPLQTQFFEAGGRAYCLAPSLRLIADLGEEVLHTNIAGGPSDRRFSRWYCSGLAHWLDGTYKALRPKA